MLRILRGWLSGPRFARRMMNGSDTRVLLTRSELFRRALDLIPGGVNSPVRAMRAVGLDEPLFVDRGEGAYLEDVDGNRYVDWVMSWGPLIFGHADAETVAAVRAAAERGTSFGAPTEAEVELAAEIVDAVPSVEKVRLVSSGTEAAMSAVRLARGFTKRDRIITFAGCYHGDADSFLAHAGSGLATPACTTSSNSAPPASRRAWRRSGACNASERCSRSSPDATSPSSGSSS